MLQIQHQRLYNTTVDPPNKGHLQDIKDNINSADLFLVERFSSLGGSKYVVGIILAGTVSHVLCREVYHTVSLFGICMYSRARL